ncbi:MAG: type II secretion system F family protein [Actinomycetota bacterium]
MLLLAMLMLGLAIFLVSEVATAPQRRRTIALKRAAAYGAARRNADEEIERFKERVFVPAVERLAQLALRVNPKVSAEAIGSRLIAAGLAARISTSQFLAVKSGLALGGVLLGLLFGVAVGPLGGFLLAVVCAGGGFFVPELVLSAKIKARREQIRSELPDALDLLAVSVEAGLGLDGAIAKLTEHMGGALVDEFALALSEMRIGEARQDALKKMAERVPAPELASFVRSVLQADTLGISLGRILRVQAADSRNRRQTAAEEKAMKAPIKMLFPTTLFIFPAMFVVILGPAVLNFTHSVGFK